MAPSVHAGAAAPPQPTPQPQPTDEHAAPQPTCRICWGGEGEVPDSSQGPTASGRLLLGTCDCSGSLAAIHAGCLMDWRRHAPDPSTCSTCRARVRLPPGLAASVRLPPLWRERLQRALGEARARPAAAAFSLWNWAVVASGLAHALLSAHDAWLSAPATACALQQRVPLAQRWQLLPTVACAAAYQAAMGPAPLGRVQTRWLAGHTASFAAGLALEALAQRLQPAAVRRTAAGGAVGAMRSAGGALPLLLGSTAVLLQAAGLQHLHPFLSLVRGYHRGLGRAFKWTASLLGAGGAAHLASLAQLLPVLAHGLFRVLA